MIKQKIKSTLLILVGIFLGFLISNFQAKPVDINHQALLFAKELNQKRISILEQRSAFDLLHQKNLILKLSSYRIKTNDLKEKSNAKYILLTKQLNEQKKQLIEQKEYYQSYYTLHKKRFELAKRMHEINVEILRSSFKLQDQKNKCKRLKELEGNRDLCTNFDEVVKRNRLLLLNFDSLGSELDLISRRLLEHSNALDFNSPLL